MARATFPCLDRLSIPGGVMSTTEFTQDAKFEFGRVVSQTFALMGRNFIPFFVLALLFVGIPQFGLLYAQSIVGLGDPSMYALMAFGGALVTMVSSFILQGALTRAAIDDLSGSGVKFGAAIGDGLRYFFPLLIVGILVGLGTGLGFMLLVVPGIILAVRWSITSPIVVVEKSGPTSSMGRSAELSKGHRWAIFGLVLLYLVLAYGVQIVLGLILGATGQASDALQVFDVLGTGLVFAIATAVTAALLSLVSTLGAASLYFELRRVKEGVGVDELAKVFE